MKQRYTASRNTFFQLLGKCSVPHEQAAIITPTPSTEFQKVSKIYEK